VNITIPELTLVDLIGPSGCGKSSFARAHFKPTEVLSSDFCRGLVSDDENAQAATTDAFEVLHFVARKRLAGGRLTVVDATNVQPEARKPLSALQSDAKSLNTFNGLGYRGLIVRSTDSPESWLKVGLGTIAVVQGTKESVYHDQGRTIERWLLNTAKGRINDRLIAAAGLGSGDL
jgi:hypothetical protein